MTHHEIDDAAGVLARLERATNAHDVNALVACFAPDYRNETPAHPARSFTGREQVRRNWEQIFAAIPDLTAKVLRSAVSGDEAWTEWEHRGTRRDGSMHVMRGVVIFGVSNGLLARRERTPGHSDRPAAGGARPGRSRADARSDPDRAHRGRRGRSHGRRRAR